MWNASPVRAPPTISAKTVAPRASACAAASTTSTPAASPNTKPSRSASNGRDAASGSSLRFESAPMFASAAKLTGRIALSVPPATTTSTSPCSMRRWASTKAWTPAAQAATEVMTGPRIPFWMLIWQAAMEGDIIGTMNGLTRAGPFASRVSWPNATSPMPPPPVFMTTATSSRLWSLIASAASSSAWRAAATANWAKRAMRRACLKSIQSRGSKPLTSAAIWTSWSEGSNGVMRPTPDVPAVRFAQKVATSLPMGVIAPMPGHDGTPARITRRRAAGHRAYASKRCRMTVLLCPPRPIEFESATRASVARATFGT